jgi:hypothetical protein
MRLAVIGRDRYIDQLVFAARKREDIQVVLFYPDSPGDQLPGVSATEGWESLAAETDVDAVLVAAAKETTRERRAEQLRMLIQMDLSLLVVHPGCEAIVAFEIEMQAEAESVRLITYQPWASHPVWDSVANCIRNPGSLGSVSQVVLERRLERDDHQIALHALAQDACIIRRLIGPIQRISALSSDASGLASSAIQMVAGPQQDVQADAPTSPRPTAQWSRLHLPPVCDLRVQLIGSLATATLQWQEGQAPQWIVDGQEVQLARFDAADNALERLRNLQPGLDDWIEASRGTELAEAAERSGKRGRAVDLYEESHTEENTFKGVMAASGCMLLLMILLGFVIGAVVEGVRFPYAKKIYQARVKEAARTGQVITSHTYPLWLRLMPAYPVVFFLLLQTLWFVTARGHATTTVRRE